MPAPHVANRYVRNRAIVNARSTRESYVPTKLSRIIGEEGKLLMIYDSLNTREDLPLKLSVMDRIIRLRLLILRFIGWPKEPTLKTGRMPESLAGAARHNPLTDIEAVELPQSEVPEVPGA